MDNELYLIHLDDYLSHIDHKLEMYELLLELVDDLREDLTVGEASQAVRTLCAYEQQAHVLFERWTIPDSYKESGDPDDLSQLMKRELLPAWDKDEDADMEDDGMSNDSSATVRLLRAVGQVNQGTAKILEVIKAMAAFETAISRITDNCEGPENSCAERQRPLF